MKEKTVKVKTNVTVVKFNLYTVTDGGVVSEEISETIQHKRDKKYLTNYLATKYAGHLATEIVSFEHKKLVSEIDFSTIVENGEFVSGQKDSEVA